MYAYPACIDAAVASQVGALGSVSNAASGPTLALPAMTSNASQPGSGFFPGSTPVASAAESFGHILGNFQLCFGRKDS